MHGLHKCSDQGGIHCGCVRFESWYASPARSYIAVLQLIATGLHPTHLKAYNMRCETAKPQWATHRIRCIRIPTSAIKIKRSFKCNAQTVANEMLVYIFVSFFGLNFWFGQSHRNKTLELGIGSNLFNQICHAVLHSALLYFMIV